jgi:hypothetical protein
MQFVLLPWLAKGVVQFEIKRAQAESLNRSFFLIGLISLALSIVTSP